MIEQQVYLARTPSNEDLLLSAYESEACTHFQQKSRNIPCKGLFQFCLIVNLVPHRGKAKVVIFL